MTALSLSIVVPGPGADWQGIAEELLRELDALGVDGEIIVSGWMVPPDTAATVSSRVRLVEPNRDGFGSALRTGLDAAGGEYVMTVDPECVGAGAVVRDLWMARADGEIIVASRYVAGARTRMSIPRRLASRVMSTVFGHGLSIPVTDVTSPFQLYRADVLREQRLNAHDHDLRPEILVRALAGGWQVCEIPLRVVFGRRTRSLGPLLRLGGRYVRTFGALWYLRNSIQAGDYDARAHDSRIPLQRYWQRQRYKHITELMHGQGAVLDVGCGSSKIISALPPGSVALDVLANKLRYARRYGKPLVRASGFTLPFADASFPCVVCSQVIEHVPMESPMLRELCRVLAPGGRLVLGTPDYDRWEWVYMEKAYGFFKPGGYADEHIAHYTRAGLESYFAGLGYVLEETRYILRGELILAFRKPAPSGDVPPRVEATAIVDATSRPSPATVVHHPAR